MTAQELKTILLVDNHTNSVTVVSRQLEKFGYTVIYAYTGEEAIDRAKRHETVDLILMDVTLGNGMDGAEAAKQILTTRNIPIVFLSSHTECDIIEKFQDITHYGFVLKNADEFVLQSTIGMAFKLFEVQQQLKNELHERKRVDKTLLESEQQYRDLVECSLEAVVVHVDGSIVYANQSAVRMFGTASVQECVGSPITRFVYTDNRQVALSHLPHSNENGASTGIAECKYRRVDGTVIDAEAQEKAIIFGGSPAIQITMRDITEHKQIGRTSVLALLETILESTDNGILVVDLAGSVLKVNGRFGEMWRIPSDILAIRRCV